MLIILEGNKMKKIVYVIGIIISFCIVFIPIYYFLNGDDIYYKNKFKNNKDSFLCLAAYFEEIYRENNFIDLDISLIKKNSEYEFIIQSDLEIQYFLVDKELYQEIENVMEAFGDLYWQKTIVTSQGISFSIEGNNYAFVYTFDGSEPQYMNSKNEPFKIKVKSIGDKCFFVKSVSN